MFTLASAAWPARALVAPTGGPRAWHAASTAAIVAAVSIGYRAGTTSRGTSSCSAQKYDSVIDRPQGPRGDGAYLATLPGARDTLIGDANTDGTAWMYAVAGLHPLWTHYDYPVQQGPGYHRFIFWAYADDADTDPRVAEAVRALDIRYVMTSTPVVREFVMPDGLSVAGQVTLVGQDLRQRRAPASTNGAAR